MLRVKRRNLTAEFDGERWTSSDVLIARMLNDNANPVDLPSYLGTPEQRAAGLARELGFELVDFEPPETDPSVVY